MLHIFISVYDEGGKFKIVLAVLNDLVKLKKREKGIVPKRKKAISTETILSQHSMLMFLKISFLVCFKVY